MSNLDKRLARLEEDAAKADIDERQHIVIIDRAGMDTFDPDGWEVAEVKPDGGRVYKINREVKL